jgi:putative SOS response-associated peptidase YedK
VQHQSLAACQEAIRRLFRKVNHYVGNLVPMCGVSPDYPAPVIRNAGHDRKMMLIRWGTPPSPKWRAAGDQHPEHLFTALAEAGAPLSGAILELP